MTNNQTQGIHTLRDYFNLAAITLSDKGEHLNRGHSLIGMRTELGESLDAIKRHIFYGKPLNIVNLCEELGDTCWYTHIPAIELITKGIDKVEPHKYSDLVMWMDRPIGEFVTHAVAEFVMGEDEDGEDLTSEDKAQEAFVLEECVSTSKTNIYALLETAYKGSADEDFGLVDLSSFILKRMALTSFVLGIPFIDILRGNIGKLLKRYPKERFDALDTTLRNLSEEANIVEAAIGSAMIKYSESSQGTRYVVEIPYYDL